MLLVVGVADADVAEARSTRGPPWPSPWRALVMTFIQWDNITDEGPKFLVGDALSFDAFSMFGTITILVAMILAALITDDYLRREGMEGPEVYAPLPDGRHRRHGDGDGERPDRAVPRPRDAVDRALRAGRQPSPPHREPGERHQVLRARRLLVGVLPLRHRPRLRRHRHRPTSTRSSPRSTTSPPSARTRSCWSASRCCSSASCFKVAAAPFHFWTPDVYQGAPTPVTAFMASAGKVAAFAAMLRVLVVALPNWKDDWRPVIWVVAVLTLVVGSISAVVQTNVKRMLAYSSISHAGFILHRRRGRRPRRRLRPVRACPARCCTCCSTPCSCAARSLSSRWSAAPATTRPTSIVPRAGQAEAAAGAGADGVPARPGRRAAHVRVRRQVRRDPGCRRRAQLRDRRSSRWCAR